jgi:hypothetical protein
MAAPKSPRERAGIRNAAGLRPAPAPEVAVPPVLQADAEPASVPQARDEAVPVARRPVRPVRITVDLAADLHGFLRGYAQARDVAAADVMRELIRQLREDGQLSAKVTAELERRRVALAEAMRAARE